MAIVRDLNFKLNDIEDETMRDHFVEVQEVHDEQKIASLYENGFGIFSDSYDTANSFTPPVTHIAPGEIVFLSVRVQNSTGGWIQIAGQLGGTPTDIYILEGEPNNPTSYSIQNNVSTVIFPTRVFIIYKRP